MDEPALTALRQSIEKWERNVAADDMNAVWMGFGLCPLCKIFHPFYSGNEFCTGCPVSQRSGMSGCEKTPYDEATNALNRWYDKPKSKKARAAWRAAAQAEVDFLRSLLPRSQIEIEESSAGLHVVTLPEWLAQEKGLI